MVAADPHAPRGALKHIGGSQSDNWNDILAQVGTPRNDCVGPDAFMLEGRRTAKRAILQECVPRDDSGRILDKREARRPGS
jgi:hypothetical protein